MKIYFVRHGHPNYKLDCLTDQGQLQAAACAERLRYEGIEKIYASSKGRALETAGYTARLLGLDVEACDFMREIPWSPKVEGGERVQPWNVSKVHVAMGQDITRTDWREIEPYCNSRMAERADVVEAGIDEWLQGLGYVREGQYYRVVGEDTDRTVAMFSHAGASNAAIAHMLNVPFPMLCGIMHPQFTSISVITLSDKIGSLITPHIELLNDARHIRGIETEQIISD